MKIQRKSYARLIEWKENSDRKPLLLRGARQVGKTTLVREFAHSPVYLLARDGDGDVLLIACSDCIDDPHDPSP